MTKPELDLRPYQQVEYEALLSHPRFAIWSEAGLGKTRPLIAAAGEDTVVVAPASVRDTLVWEREAERVGLPAPRVISYHAAAKGVPASKVLILDEAHRAKERKVSWAEPLYDAAWKAERVYHSTGTPMPNAAFELWAQLRMLRPRSERHMRYYWPWVREWFAPAPTKYDAYASSDRLLNCYCAEDEQDQTCAHWQAFYDANVAGYALRHRRDDVMRDLPPLVGADYPLWSPMTPGQRKVYLSLKKDFLAQIPEHGITLEALSDSGKFVMLHQAASGLSVLDPAADPKHKNSGKLIFLREQLKYADRPILVVVWYKNSARAVGDLCTELGIDWRALGSKTTSKQRAQTVLDFGAGEVPVLVASLSVVKEGVDGLQYGSDEVVMFERSWVPGDNEQVIRRLHRLGQTRPVTARQLVTPRTVDAEQWRDQTKKGNRIGRVLRPAEIAAMLG